MGACDRRHEVGNLSDQEAYQHTVPLLIMPRAPLRTQAYTAERQLHPYNRRLGCLPPSPGHADVTNTGERTRPEHADGKPFITASPS